MEHIDERKKHIIDIYQILSDLSTSQSSQVFTLHVWPFPLG